MDTAEIPSVAAVVILDGDGKRIVTHYYRSHFSTVSEEMAFEKKLFDKTARTNAKNEAEIIILDGLVTVYRNSCDIWLYIVGTQTENELILVNVLSALHEALSTLLRCEPAAARRTRRRRAPPAPTTAHPPPLLRPAISLSRPPRRREQSVAGQADAARQL